MIKGKTKHQIRRNRKEKDEVKHSKHEAVKTGKE